jgi:hypothetical protein
MMKMMKKNVKIKIIYTPKSNSVQQTSMNFNETILIYKFYKRHPERLRNCIKCVGVQREEGKNVREATKYCNSVCKRDLIDEVTERDLVEDDQDEIDERKLMLNKK